MKYLLGVDGGNTKTVALVAQEDGTILGGGRSGCGDIYGGETAEAAIDEIEKAVEAALKEAGIEREEVGCAAFSLAGADWESDFDFLTEKLGERRLGKEIRVYNDAIGSLRAGSADGTGVALACGTGTAVGARNAEGHIWHSSFWQEPLCGHEMGSKALRAVYRAELGVDRATSLTDAVLEHFGETGVEAMLYRFTAREVDNPEKHDVARLSRVVLNEAAAGDAVARELVTGFGARLGDYALAAAKRVGLDGTAFTLVFNGGVFRHESNVMKDAVLERVRAAAPDVQPISSELEPAAGALLLAFEGAGIVVGKQMIENVRQTMPEGELFET